jgi:hypothetical protein
MSICLVASRPPAGCESLIREKAPEKKERKLHHERLGVDEKLELDRYASGLKSA